MTKYPNRSSLLWSHFHIFGFLIRSYGVESQVWRYADDAWRKAPSPNYWCHWVAGAFQGSCCISRSGILRKARHRMQALSLYAFDFLLCFSTDRNGSGAAMDIGIGKRLRHFSSIESIIVLCFGTSKLTYLLDRRNLQFVRRLLQHTFAFASISNRGQFDSTPPYRSERKDERQNMFHICVIVSLQL